MSETETKMLAYVGRALGTEPVTDLRNGFHVTWDQVRAVPASIAAALMKANPGQFALVDTLPEAAKRYSIKAERLADLAAAGKLRTGTFKRKGEEAQVVVILDEQTQAGIDAEHKRATKKDKE